MDEFEQRFPEFLNKVRDTSAIFGTDEGRVLDTLKGIKNESTNSKWNATNFWNAVDVLPAVGGIFKTANIIDKSIAAAGAKSVLSRSVANAAITAGPSPLVSNGTTASTITAGAFTKYNIPTGASALTDKFLAQAEAVREAVKKIPTGELNSQEEILKAVDDTVKAVDDSYKRHSVIEHNVSNLASLS